MAVSCSVGHKGKFGHEFLEFEFRPDGKLRYANKCVCSLRAVGSPASRSIELRNLTAGLSRCAMQLELQERHDDPQGNIRERERDG